MRAKRITGAWAEQKIVREIMVFLHSHGVGTARAVRIFKTYGADAVQVMTENPYRLARDIRGIGFKTADAIAMRLGIEKTAMIRVRAGISYALTEAMDEGHCGLPTEELVPLAVELLEVPAELVQTALDLELAERTVIADTVGETACIFLAGLYRAEQVIAERILRLVNGTLPWPYIDPEKALPWIEQKTGLSLAESQIAAIRLALLVEGPRHHRRAGRRQDDHRQLDLAHPGRQGCEPVAVRPDRPCRQAHDRSYGIRGFPGARDSVENHRPDHPSADRQDPGRSLAEQRCRALPTRRDRDDPDEGRKRSVTGACRWSSLRAMIGHGSDNDGSVHYRLGGH